MAFKIIKTATNEFWHEWNSGAKRQNVSDFDVVIDSIANTFVIVLRNGANIPQSKLIVTDIIVIDQTDASIEETFTSVVDLKARLKVLGYTPYQVSGGGSSAVDSVNGQIGIVVLDASDITETATRKWVSPTEKNNWNAKPDTQDVIDAIAPLASDLSAHTSNISNPHSVTKAQVGLSNVPNTDCTAPSNIAQDTTHRFVTDTEKSTWNGKENAISAGTTSQYYRGDKSWQTLDKSAVGLSNVDNTSDVDKPVSTAQQTALDLKEDKTNITNNYKRILLNDNSLGSALTGSGSLQSAYSVLIPANTFADLSTFEVEGVIFKTSGSATVTRLRIAINTSNTLTGATEIATTQSFTAGTTYMPIKRQFVIRSGNIEGISLSTQLITDESFTINPTYSVTAFNPAVDNYIFLTFTNTGDTIQKRLFTIEKTLNKTTLS